MRELKTMTLREIVEARGLLGRDQEVREPATGAPVKEPTNARPGAS